MVKEKNPSPGILDWIIDFFVKPLRDAITNLVKGFSEPVNVQGRDAFNRLLTAYAVRSPSLGTPLLKAKSPITPEEAYKQAWDLVKEAEDRINTGMGQSIAIEAASLGQLDVTLGQLLSHPTVRRDMELATSVRLAEVEAAITPLLRRYWLKQYKPFIPPIQDLRVMAVREAFPVEPGEPQYKEMEKWAIEQGMDPFWTQRYLLMGFERMDIRQAYENLWRGFWNEDKFKSFLRIADIHPDDRDPILKVAFRPPGIREMGYGYDVGHYSVEDIVKYRRWGGLSEEDATKAAASMVAYRTEAEREALRREALYDYTDGLDSVEDLRGKLEAIGGRPEIIDLWVARAEYRADRDRVKEEITLMRDAAIKGWISMTDLEVELKRRNVQQWKVDQVKAYVTLRRKVDPEVKKLLTPAQIGRLYRDRKIPHEEAVKRLQVQAYDKAEAELFLMLYEPKEEGD